MATDPQAHATHAGYELSDAKPRGIFIFFAWISVFLVLTALVVAWLFGFFVRTALPPASVARPFENSRSIPPPPLLQASPNIDIQQFVQSQQNALNSYGWVDRQQGIVHIPIDRAMDLLSQKGFPARAPQSDAPATQRGDTDSPASSGTQDRSEVQP